MMKQVTQRLRDGVVEVLDVPEPVLTEETVLIDVRASLLSAGTERAKVKAGKQSLIGKARARPDQVAQVIEKARNDGVLDTVRAVRTRLDQPSVLGYSAAGVVLAVGNRVRGVAVGERVAVGGGEHAVHAEIDRVAANLCVPLPETVSFDEGCFACVGSIALHGVRQAGVSLGERVAVIGLGLVGQLTGLLLRAAGCTVVGIDLDAALADSAGAVGAADVCLPRAALGEFLTPEAESCDAVIVAASTSSNDPVELAPRLCRDRGRVVIVGDVGLQIPRAAYYEKEIDLRLSRSYGPGRYDRAYEQHGQDYPIAYVRWTEGRNMKAIIELIAAGRLPVKRLITARIPVEDAPTAYARLVADDASPLGIVLTYDSAPAVERPSKPALRSAGQAPRPGNITNVIGAGSFAQRILIPGLKKAGFELRFAASASGISAQAAADRFGFAAAVPSAEAVEDPGADLVAIATRHASHSALAEAALRAGKSVFVEKPPCLTQEELSALRDARARSDQHLFVGFNRRFAPLAQAMRDHIRAPGAPIHLLLRVSAPSLPRDHWLNDPDDGGGRLLGEGCHFIDLACWMVGGIPTTVYATIQPRDSETLQTAQGFTVSLGYADGSLATILYTDGGASGLGKEHVEAHAGGRSAVLHDFRRLELHDGRSTDEGRRRRQDKGHHAQFADLYACVAERRPEETLGYLDERGEARSDFSLPDPLDTMHVTLSALASAQAGGPIPPGVSHRRKRFV